MTFCHPHTSYFEGAAVAFGLMGMAEAIRTKIPRQHTAPVYTAQDMGATTTFDGETLSLQVCGRAAVTVAVTRAGEQDQ